MRRSIINSVAAIIIFTGSFLALSDLSYAKQPAKCVSGDGDVCICQRGCWATQTQCGCI